MPHRVGVQRRAGRVEEDEAVLARQLTVEGGLKPADLNGDGSVTLLEIRQSAPASTDPAVVTPEAPAPESTGGLSLFDFAAQQGAYQHLAVQAADLDNDCGRKIATLGGVVDTPCD